MDAVQAEEIALQYLRKIETLGEIDLILLRKITIEKQFGWVFFYDSKQHQKSKKLSDALTGNAPLIVTKPDGKLYVTGTALPIEEYILKFEEGDKSGFRSL